MTLGIEHSTIDRNLWRLNYTLGTVRVEAHATRTGVAAISWRERRSHFVIGWSNPLWTALDLQLPADLEPVYELIGRYFDTLPVAVPQATRSVAIGASVCDVVYWNFLQYWRSALDWGGSLAAAVGYGA